MFLTAMHVSTVLLVALVMGTTLAHALEMPAKMRVSGSFWVECQHTLYRFFRYIAGPIEVAAVLISAALAYFTLRDQKDTKNGRHADIKTDLPDWPDEVVEQWLLIGGRMRPGRCDRC
jgi:hypothetical protein